MKTPMRHGVAVLLVLLLCASLFLVYNGSFNGASRDANDTRIRQHEQQRRPTEASVRVAKPHPPALQGYSGIIDHKVSRSHCSTLNTHLSVPITAQLRTKSSAAF
uniref:Uncharacterized protein n=1 Tax=Amphiprion percula TaxID=161767 RepID=A0A3P8SWG6_AMPPE